MNKVLQWDCYGNKRRNGESGVGSPTLPVPHLAGFSTWQIRLQKKSMSPRGSGQWNPHPGVVATSPL